VSQPKPATEKSPYYDLAEKYGLKIDFRPFIKVEGLPAKDFRQQKITILDHTAVIFTARHGIDHFFRLCDEMRIAIPEEMKYFCMNEQVALYLQKYIVYRKRKIFHTTSGKNDELVLLILKHNTEKFLIPVSDVSKEDLTIKLDEKKLAYTKAVMYRTVSNEFLPGESFDYDMLVFFSPSGITSLLKNFPDFNQGELAIGCFGATTAKAVRDAGLRLDCEAPTAEFPSMTGALEQFIKENHKAAKKLWFNNTNLNTLFSGGISYLCENSVFLFLTMVQQLTFTKQEKLSGETAVNELFMKGVSFIAYPFRVVWTVSYAEGESTLEVLMSVPKKKLKHAVDRNRVKRLLREAYRLNKGELFNLVVEHGLKVRMAFVWIPTEVLEYSKVERKVVDALNKMQKLLIQEQTPTQLP